jgi:hypothetical protein
MTREEAMKIFRYEVDRQEKFSEFGYSFENLLHEVYDNFESRTCSNCKHLEYIEKSFKRCSEIDINIGHITEYEFYCAYWENRDE